MSGTNVRDLVLRLLGDDEQRSVFMAEPGATLARNGFEGFTDSDVTDLVGHVAASVTPDEAVPLVLFGEDGWEEFVEAPPAFESLVGVSDELAPPEHEPLDQPVSDVPDSPDEAIGDPTDELDEWDFDHNVEPLTFSETADDVMADEPDDAGDLDDPFDLDLG